MLRKGFRVRVRVRLRVRVVSVRVGVRVRVRSGLGLGLDSGFGSGLGCGINGFLAFFLFSVLNAHFLGSPLPLPLPSRFTVSGVGDWFGGPLQFGGVHLNPLPTSFPVRVGGGGHCGPFLRDHFRGLDPNSSRTGQPA